MRLAAMREERRTDGSGASMTLVDDCTRRNFMSRLWARHGELLGLASAPDRLLSASDALTQQLLDEVQKGVSKLGGQLPTTEALVGSMAAQEAQAAAPSRRGSLRRTSVQAPSP